MGAFEGMACANDSPFYAFADPMRCVAFMMPVQRALSTKITVEQLNEVKMTFDAQIEECRTVLLAQMTLVREKAERTVDDFDSIAAKVRASSSSPLM